MSSIDFIIIPASWRIYNLLSYYAMKMCRKTSCGYLEWF